MWSRFVMSQVKHNSYFIMGMMIGLWVSLSVIPLDEEVVTCASAPLVANEGVDEFEPHREERPLGPAGQTAGRSVQRPRYYTTELGMRGSVLTGVLSSEERLRDQVAAINKTAARLQPALKFFITASAVSAPPGLANVVGFTDTREMLKPFHALKYLADNYLEEYDFFFLVTDAGYVNARRLAELAGSLSVSRDLYMGVPEPDSQYCSLDSGVLLSNSVLRAVHAELDWCVRNSYSPRHHENVGRCVLHAAHVPCTSTAQAQEYSAARGEPLTPPVDAVTAGPAPAPALLRLHALGARERLTRGRVASRRLRGALRRCSARHPLHYRNATWPAGLRDDPGLAPPRPDSRFDHLRWTAFDTERAYMPDERRSAAPHPRTERAALDALWQEVSAWCMRTWPESPPELVEGARLWEPARALRYRLVVRAGGRLRALHAARALTAARLAPVPYVTESARIALVITHGESGSVTPVAALLRRIAALCAPPQPDCNLAVYVTAGDPAAETELRNAGRQLPSLTVQGHPGHPAGGSGSPLGALGARAVLDALLPDLPRDQPVLLVPTSIEFDRDFLNRVRMNTIRGEQWYLPVPFSRFAQTRVETGSKPPHSGRFELSATSILSFYKEDYEKAAGLNPEFSVAEVLAASGLRSIRAPEPGAALAPPPPPCAPTAPASCRQTLLAQGLDTLALGTRASLAKLLLETQDSQ